MFSILSFTIIIILTPEPYDALYNKAVGCCSHVYEMMLQLIEVKSCSERLVIKTSIVSMAVTKPRCQILIFSISASFKMRE